MKNNKLKLLLWLCIFGLNVHMANAIIDKRNINLFPEKNAITILGESKQYVEAYVSLVFLFENFIAEWKEILATIWIV